MGGLIISPLPPVSVKELQNSRAPSLRGRYPASTLLRAPPPPSRLRPTSRGRRLYGLPVSAAFAAGRGGRLHLLAVPSSPCRRPPPPPGRRPVRRAAAVRSAFALRLRARPPGLRTVGATSAFTCVTARGLAGHPEDDRVDGLQTFGFPPACHPSYGVSALTPAGLTPAEHISLFWTHNRAGGFPAPGSRTRRFTRSLTACCGRQAGA